MSAQGRVYIACLPLVFGACSSSPSASQGASSGASSRPDAASGHRDGGHSASGVGEAGTDAPTAEDAHPMVIDDPHDCVALSATSSANGVGGYCSPKGGQCVHAGTGGTPSLCSADFGAPAHEWFCTTPCATTSDCGAGGGTCIATTFGDFCVPASCLAGLGDAALPDASGAVDAGPDAAPDSGERRDGQAGTSDAGGARDAQGGGASDAAPHDAQRG